jgi:large subunit ribosomal protein L5
MGVGKAIESSAHLDNAVKDLTAITGQKPQITRAKKSISNFKLREGMPIGCRVTLRGERMYEFLDRLVNVALPRIRDFRGVPTKLSGRGDYSLGLREQFIFPEIEFDKIDAVRGMSITIVTTSQTDEEGRELLRLFGMPFRN